MLVGGGVGWAVLVRNGENLPQNNVNNRFRPMVWRVYMYLHVARYRYRCRRPTNSTFESTNSTCTDPVREIVEI